MSDNSVVNHFLAESETTRILYILSRLIKPVQIYTYPTNLVYLIRKKRELLSLEFIFLSDDILYGIGFQYSNGFIAHFCRNLTQTTGHFIHTFLAALIIIK